MKKLVVACAAVALGASAFAVDYTWNGGTSGEWTTSDNWTPDTGYPNGADDTAAFAPGEATAVTVGSAIAVKGISISGAGGLTLTGAAITLGADGIASTSTASCGVSNDVSIAAAQTMFKLTGSGPLHMGGVISGAGGINKQGHAYIHLYRDNPFTGIYQAWGDRTRPDGTAIGSSATADGSGDTFIYAGGALGTQKATFDSKQGLNANCARLIVVGGMTIDTPMEVTGDYNNNGSVVFLGDGDVTFNGDMDSRGRFRSFLRVAKNVHFKGKLTHNNYLDLHGVSGSDYHLYAPINGSCYVTIIGTGDVPEVHLYSTESVSCNWFQDNGVIVCEDTNVIPPQLDYFELPRAACKIDLNGFDQEVRKFVVAKFVQASSGHGFVSATPAKFRFVGTSVPSFGARWSFYGSAGFEWDPQTADTTFVQSNAVSETRGALAVTSGKYRLANGASFTSLSSFSVGATATFEVESGSGVNFLAGACTIAEGATFNLPAGVNLKVGTLQLGEQSVSVGTVLTSTTHPNLITGAGAISVTGSRILPRNEWIGADGASWTDPENWSLKAVPSADYEAYIGSGTVTVDAATPKVGLITVADGATITCSGPFTDETDKKTLHLVCGDLVVEKGGKIDATQKGWSGGEWTGTPPADPSQITDSGKWSWTAKHATGYGPGVSSSGWVGYSGGDHGGLGGSWRLLDRKRVAYGDAAHPTTAGSGGDLPISYGGEIQRDISSGTVGYCRGCSGGGVIRIEATGTVRVDGEIRADGKGHNNTGGSRDCASAGGSVWITCRTIGGSGVVSAAGGSQGDPRFPFNWYRETTGTDGRYGHPGGGGRIAIDYDPAAEAVENVDGLLITAAAGEYYKDWVTLATRDLYESKAEAGTLHFTDTALVKRLFGNGLSGRVVGLTSLEFEGDLDFRRGFFQPAEEGFTLTVGGNLTITNKEARLEVGGVCMTNRAARTTTYAGTQVNRLTVGGDLVIDNGGSLAVRSAEQPEAPLKERGKASGARWGAEVTVDGAMTIGNKSCVYAAADGLTLAAPKFTVGSLTVAEGGIFSADRGGGLGKDFHNATMMEIFFGTSDQNQFATSMTEDHMDWFGYGPGGGYKCNAAGHGGTGRGGRSFSTSDGSSTYGIDGVAYDDQWFPVWAGSGGGSISGNDKGGEGGTGGGIIHVTSAGPIVVNGTVSADGWCSSSIINSGDVLKSGINSHAAGSGGTVYLAGDTFSCGAKAKISAKGGSSMQSKEQTNYTSGTGAGGCIAIWTGMSHYLTGKYKTFKDVVYSKHADLPAEYADVFDATAGDPLFVDSSTRNEAQMKVLMGCEGTVAFGHYTEKPGGLLILR